MKRILTLSAMVAALCAGTAIASDARSIALGGAVIANGTGVPGVLSNPASMMAMKRRGEKTHFRTGFFAEFRDTGNALDTLTETENEDLVDDIEAEIDIISATSITCDVTFDENMNIQRSDETCIEGTQELSDISGRVLNILEILDEESIEGIGGADIGMAFTQADVPFAVNLRLSVAASGTPDIADGDLAYVSEFSTLFNEDLTLNEILDSQFLVVNNNGGPLTVQQPEDVLQSEATTSAVARTQLGVSFATSVILGGAAVDIGVTPKLSYLVARSLRINVSEEFVEETVSAADRFEDSEVTETSFTADIGASMSLRNAPVRLAGVIRNLIPESITTNDGVEFETTPQLILGAAFENGRVTVTGDIALNEAEQDNFVTQKMGLGIEFDSGFLALRGGISNDAARETDSTALSLGIGLGALDIGGRLTSLESAEFGAQLSFSF